MSDTKQCSMCYEVKPVEEFYANKRVIGGRRSECRQCKLENESKCTSFVPYDNKGYHNADVAAVILDDTIEEYNVKFAIIKAFNLDMDSISDTPKINRVLELMAI